MWLFRLKKKKNSSGQLLKLLMKLSLILHVISELKLEKSSGRELKSNKLDRFSRNSFKVKVYYLVEYAKLGQESLKL